MLKNILRKWKRDRLKNNKTKKKIKKSNLTKKMKKKVKLKKINLIMIRKKIE